MWKYSYEYLSIKYTIHQLHQQNEHFVILCDPGAQKQS